MKTENEILLIVRKNMTRVKRHLFDRDILKTLEFVDDYGFDIIDGIEFSAYCSQDLGIEVSFEDVKACKTIGEFVTLLCDRCQEPVV